MLSGRGTLKGCWHSRCLYSYRRGFLHSAKLPEDLPKPFCQQSQLCYFSCTGLLPLIYQKMDPGVALHMGSNTTVAVKPKNMRNIRFIHFLNNLCLEQDKQVQYFRRY